MAFASFHADAAAARRFLSAASDDAAA